MTRIDIVWKLNSIEPICKVLRGFEEKVNENQMDWVLRRDNDSDASNLYIINILTTIKYRRSNLDKFWKKEFEENNFLTIQYR